ncbi:MAG TPA: hypothetical protein VF796_26145 [Humisphaera sp.]
MRLHDALNQIAEIRQQMARAQVFRGYRSATTAFSAVMALVAAGLQYKWFGPGPRDAQIDALWVWLAAAGVSLAVVGAEMALRYRRSGASPLARETTLLAVEQFAPCLVAGATLTYGVVEWAGNSINLLPAIWCTLFGLGVFASRRLLPRGTFAVGAWYLLAGMACVAVRTQVPFSAQMAVAFGGGQLLAAGVLYWTLERTPAPRSVEPPEP